MGYSFVTIQKYSNMSDIQFHLEHNTRQTTKENIISELSKLNVEYTSPGDSFDVSGDKKNGYYTYKDVFDSRIKSLDYYKDHSIHNKRFDSRVKAIEVVMSYSKDENIDPKKWGEKSMEWLHATFDTAGDGRSNVISAVLHLDEPGNPHIHAIIIPIDERGHLNAKSFLNGGRLLSYYQDTYADAVKEFGLKRGIRNSTASHKTLSQMYKKVNQVKADICKPKEGQTAQEYYDELHEQIEDMILSEYKKISDSKVRAVQEIDEQRNDLREAVEDDIEASQAFVRHKSKEIVETAKKEKDDLIQEKNELQEELDYLNAQLKAWEFITEDSERKKSELDRYEKIQKGIGLLQEEDPEKADAVIENIRLAETRADEYEQFPDDRNISQEKDNSDEPNL